MTTMKSTYSNINNAVAIGLELIVARDEKQQLVRAMLLPIGKEDIFRDVILNLVFDPAGKNLLLPYLLEAQWFPVAVEQTLTDSLDAIEARLECLPAGYAFIDEDENEEEAKKAKNINCWKTSVVNIFLKLAYISPKDVVDENFLRELFLRIPKNFGELIKVNGFN